MTHAQSDHSLSLELSTGEIHLWHTSLAADATEITSYTMLLSHDEAARADRYVFDTHRARFTAGRGILREVLSRYTGTPPEGLVFVYGPQGKPEIMQSGEPLLHFNVAHSEDRLLIGVTRGRRLGVDIEQIRPVYDLMAVARRFFSARESRALQNLLADQQAVAFFNAWTRKEALLKAYGDGISEVLNTVEVTLLPGEPSALLSIRGSTEEAQRWSLHAPDAPPGYIAALAVEQPAGRITRFDYHTI
jgi:4'-phosphopantetheinyl transferase